jgi:sulfide:quinone oxidoreductase
LPQEHRIVLVDRESTFVFSPSLLWLMTGERTAARISKPMIRLKNKGIDVIKGEIEAIDPKQREVRVSGRSFAGDYAIIALGADLAPDTVPGLAEGGHNFYSLSGAESFGRVFRDFSGGKLIVLTASPAYKCPAAPYEAAMLLEAACRKRGIRDQTEIHLHAAEPGPMGVAGPDVSRAVREMVESKQIVYHPEHQVTHVDSAARRMRFGNGAEARYDLLAYVPPHRAPQVVRSAGLASESGWISVNRSTLETVFRVFTRSATSSLFR